MENSTIIKVEGNGVCYMMPDNHTFNISFASTAKSTDTLSERYNEFMKGVEEIAKKHDENAKVERGKLTVYSNSETVKRLLGAATDTQGYSYASSSCTITSTKDGISSDLYNNLAGFGEALAEKFVQKRPMSIVPPRQQAKDGVTDSFKTSVRVEHSMTSKTLNRAYDAAIEQAYNDASRKMQAISGPVALGNGHAVAGLKDAKYVPAEIELARFAGAEETRNLFEEEGMMRKYRAASDERASVNASANFEGAVEPTEKRVRASMTVTFKLVEEKD